jgi:hypothetical protein
MGQEELIALKGEQTARIVLRDTTLYVHIASIVALYAAEGQAGSNDSLVSAIQAFAVVLAAVICSIYASNDFYISRLARFALCHGSAVLRAWENEHRAGVRYRFQKAMRTSAVLLVFPGWATLQLAPLIESEWRYLTWIAILSWGLVVSATLVFLTADVGRRVRTAEAGDEQAIDQLAPATQEELPGPKGKEG